MCVSVSVSVCASARPVYYTVRSGPQPTPLLFGALLMNAHIPAPIVTGRPYIDFFSLSSFLASLSLSFHSFLAVSRKRERHKAS